MAHSERQMDGVNASKPAGPGPSSRPTMKDEVNSLAREICRKLTTTKPAPRRLLVGIAGIPGSGKSTIAAHLTTRINLLLSPSGAPSSPPPYPLATLLPMDGFHHPRSHLRTLPNAAEAFEKRGADWTFDVARLTQFLHTIKMLNRASPPSKIVLHGPGFDHALKDPCEEGVSIDSRTRVVIVEGLYLAMITPPWDEVSSLLDLLYFVDCDRRVATNRLVRRHVATGVEATVGAAERRARGSDRDNAVWILANRIKRVDRVVESREDKLWAEVGGRGEEEGSVEDGDMGRGMDDAARGEDRDGGKVVNKQAGSMPAVGVFSPPPVTAASPSAADAKNTRRESLQKVGEFKTPGLPASSSQNNGDMAHNNGDAAGQGQRSESEVSATTGTPSPKINQTKVMPSVGVFSPAKVMDSPKRKLSSDVEGGKVQDGPNGTNGKSNDMPTKRTKT